MSFFLILSLLIAIVSIIFALQNTGETMIQFLFWRTESPIAFLLLLTFLAGVLVGILISVPSLLRLKKKNIQYFREKEEWRKKNEKSNLLPDEPKIPYA